MQTQKPQIGTTVAVTYTLTAGAIGNEKTVTFEVEEHTSDGFVGGAGIGNKVTDTGLFFTPTSSDGYHADGDVRTKIGRDAEWEVVE